MNIDEFFMQKTIELAKKGAGYTSPNPLVGAVIVKNNEIIGKGFHKKAGSFHAEVNALKDAGKKTKGATLYVNLEPCNHFGRTPPCTEAIIKSGISRVVVGIKDPNPEVSGSGISRLIQAGIEVKVGVLEKQAILLNEAFIKYITTNKPFVVAKIAQTIDGKVALSSGKSKWITCVDARKKGHELRNTYDAIMVGIGTVLADNPKLTCRLKGGKNPIKIIVDSTAKLPLESQLLQKGKVILATTKNADKNKLKALQDMGVEIITTSGKDEVKLEELLIKLGEKEVTSVLLEGGPKLLTSFCRRDLIDKLILFLAPKIIGSDGVNAVGELFIKEMKDVYKMQIARADKIGQDIKIELYPQKKRGGDYCSLGL